MSDAPRHYVLYVEKPDGVEAPRRLECDDLDKAEQRGRELMRDGLKVSIEVIEAQSVLYTLHL